MIVVNNLVREFEEVKGFRKKKRNKKCAVDCISFHIKEGEIFSLLGPNGAGKTTTIKILSTLLAPTSGECRVMGYDPFLEARKIRQKINFIFGGESGVYRRISGRENMEYFASLYNVDIKDRESKIDELLTLVGLKDAQDKRVETYSKGMIQRLQIARGLINDPEIIFLDEPTIGLDPIGARDLREIIVSLKERGRTILLTTHDMREADLLSDRIAIINHGKIVVCDTPVNLKKLFVDKNILELDVTDIDDIKINELKNHRSISFVGINKSEFCVHIELHYEGGEEVLTSVLLLLKNCKILNLNKRATQLEDVYIRLIEGEDV